MDTSIVATVVDRTIVTYTKAGLKGDQDQRQQLREIVTAYLQTEIQNGRCDPDTLVAGALKHLLSLEGKPQAQSPRMESQS